VNEEKQETLWTDGMIVARYYNAVHYPITPEQMAFVKRIRNDYEADRARIQELEETLAFAAQYKGIEARACPLCKYENGKFIEACQMHKDMKELRAQLDEASRLISLMHPIHGLGEGECEAQLASAQAGEWERLTVPEVAEIMFSYYVPEMGDDAARYYTGSVDSQGIYIDDCGYTLLGDFEIVRRVSQAQEE
jgi:hypothetical protein